MIVGTLKTNVAIQLITLATSVLTARILGPAGRGELALVLLYPQLIAVLAMSGVDRAIAVLAGRGVLSRPVGTIWKLVFLLALPAMGLGYATVLWRVSDTHLISLATIYLVYIPAVYFYMLVSFLFNGVGDFRRFNQVRMGFYLSNLALLVSIWAIMPKATLDWVVFANLASVYGALGLALWLLRGFRNTARSDDERSTPKDVTNVLLLALVFALPAALSQFGGAIYQILLAHHLGILPLGLFVVYFSYSRILAPLGSAITSHVFFHGISGDRRDIARICRLSLVAHVLCSLPLWLVAWWLIPLIFGRAFVVDLWTIALLFTSCVFSLLADSMAEYLKGHEKVRADVWGRVIYIAIAGVLGWWMVGYWALIGMASALALADLLRYGYLLYGVAGFTGQSAGTFVTVTRADVDAVIAAYRASFLWPAKLRRLFRSR